MTRTDIYNAIDPVAAVTTQLWNKDHGGDCSSPALPTPVKVAVLTEEVGEVARAALEHDTDGLRIELVQVAAIAVAWLEAM